MLDSTTSPFPPQASTNTNPIATLDTHWLLSFPDLAPTSPISTKKGSPANKALHFLNPPVDRLPHILDLESTRHRHKSSSLGSVCPRHLALGVSHLGHNSPDQKHGHIPPLGCGSPTELVNQMMVMTQARARSCHQRQGANPEPAITHNSISWVVSLCPLRPPEMTRAASSFTTPICSTLLPPLKAAARTRSPGCDRDNWSGATPGIPAHHGAQ